LAESLPPTAVNARLEIAEAFLQEAVYRSRARQAAGTALAGLDTAADVVRDAGNCGLGQKAAVELDLSARGAELFRALWPDGAEPQAPVIDGVRAVLRAWVQRQDALDRKRNHFLRDFRGSHGYDRAAYAPAALAAYEAGLAAVNAEVAAGLREAARALLSAAQPSA
jgi:hypothetical protein